MSTDKGSAPKGEGGQGDGKRMKLSCIRHVTTPRSLRHVQCAYLVKRLEGEVNGGAGGRQWAVLQ